MEIYAINMHKKGFKDVYFIISIAHGAHLYNTVFIAN